jgi:hypothetical protein
MLRGEESLRPHCFYAAFVCKVNAPQECISLLDTLNADTRTRIHHTCRTSEVWVMHRIVKNVKSVSTICHPGPV